MKTLKAVLFSAFFAYQISALANPVQIRVHGLTNDQGAIRINLFASADAWEKEAPNKVVQITPLSGTSATTTVELPPGRYMFFLFHDVDGDGQLKRGTFGLPAEPYAFSNNVQIGFSKPSFDDTSFVVGANGAVQDIQLNNP